MLSIFHYWDLSVPRTWDCNAKKAGRNVAFGGNQQLTKWKHNIKFDEVATALSKVRWAAGREISDEVAKKWIPLYDTFL